MTTISLPSPGPADETGEAVGGIGSSARDSRRRTRILAAATELFAERGYDACGVSDIAAAVAMGPAAIYRLIGSKQDLLAEVILGSLTAALDGLESVDVTTQAGLDDLADLAIQHRHLGLLWQRDTRRLTSEVQGMARALIRQFATVLTSQLGAARPELSRASTDLLAWAAVSVMVSPSLHHVEAAFDEYRRQIAVILGRILTAPIPADLPAGTPPDRGETRLLPASRREAIYLTALRLFAERGYADVSVEDIGAAVGASGPSIYHHFPSKQHLLMAAAQRASAARQVAVIGAYAGSIDPAGALDVLLVQHLRLALVHHELLSVLTMDVTYLPGTDRELFAAAEREYLDEWRYLLRQVRGTGSGIDPGAVGSLIEISCTVDVIDNIARIAHLRVHPGVVASLPALCRWMLHLRP